MVFPEYVIEPNEFDGERNCEIHPRRPIAEFGKLIMRRSIAVCRCKLATALNPKDQHDADILKNFEKLFSESKCEGDIVSFTVRIALLLKASCNSA